MNPKFTSVVRVPSWLDRLKVSPSPRKLLVEYENPTKLPEMPEMPPLNWMVFLPRSRTFSVRSTVWVLLSVFMSTDESSFSVSKYPSWFRRRMLSRHRSVLNGSPSSISSSRRITLSRVVVLPEKSMRRTKNWLPSSKRSVRLILSVPGIGSGSGSTRKLM